MSFYIFKIHNFTYLLNRNHCNKYHQQKYFTFRNQESLYKQIHTQSRHHLRRITP